MIRRKLARSGLVSCFASLAAISCAVSVDPGGESLGQSRAALSAGGAGGATSIDGADLSIWGWSDYQTLVGQSTYASFYAYNSGPSAATNVTVSFVLSGPGKFTSIGPAKWSSSPASCSFTATTATCHVDSLDAYGYLPFDVTFDPTAEGTVSLAASIGADQSDPSPWDDSTTTWTTVLKPSVADLSVAMTAGRPTVVGKPLRFDIQVTNKGPDAASYPSLYDTLPPGVTFVSATPSQGSCYGGSWGSLSCDIGRLGAGASASVALVVTASTPATITNSATVSNYAYIESDPNYANNTASSSVTVRGVDGKLGAPTFGGCGLWNGPHIDDLEDGNITFGPKDAGLWFTFNDGTGVQTPPTADGLVVPGGPGSSDYAVHSSGQGFWLWGAGFGAAFGCSYDVSRFRGVRFAVKAGGMRQVFLEVPTVELQPVEFGGRCTSGCQDYYRAPISLPDDAWYECTVGFGDLRQAGWGMAAPFDRGAVTGAQFNLEVWNAPYDLWIDNIEFAANPTGTTGCIPISR